MKTIESIVREVVNSNDEYSIRFTEVGAEWSPFQDLKIKWMRCAKQIDFSVTDYLIDAPENAVKGIFECLLAKICGDMDAEYSAEAIEYLTSGEFIKAKRPVYVSRLPDFAQSRKLTWSLKRLKKKGLIEGDNICLGFSPSGDVDEKASVLFRTAQINEKLANADKELLDYAVYKAVKYIETMKFGSNEAPGPVMAQVETSYPGWVELNERIKDIL